jgi:diphthamide synthase (EF-2-diphthine--ammonia ligase)
MTSGGKDATLALERARRSGLNVRLLVSLYDGASRRVRFHNVRKELIADQAAALGLELVAIPTPPDAYEPVFNDTMVRLRERGIETVVFGNVQLADVRQWYERRVRAAGLEHVEPLWGAPSVEVAWEVVERGYRALVVSRLPRV